MIKVSEIDRDLLKSGYNSRRMLWKIHRLVTFQPLFRHINYMSLSALDWSKNLINLKLWMLTLDFKVGGEMNTTTYIYIGFHNKMPRVYLRTGRRWIYTCLPPMLVLGRSSLRLLFNWFGPIISFTFRHLDVSPHQVVGLICKYNNWVTPLWNLKYHCPLGALSRTF